MRTPTLAFTPLSLMTAGTAVLAATAWASPITVHSSGHYFAYEGAPVLLVTSDHHYGAVINADFDYVAFLDKLKSKGLNFARIYPGAYLERDVDFYAGNPLAPANGRQILPWSRAKVPGAHEVLSGQKFDLDTWDEAYFTRLWDFCAQADDRGIIVEICLFNGMYEKRWPYQAMFVSNNIQGVGTCAWDMVQSLKADARLLSYQEKYVTEITTSAPAGSAGIDAVLDTFATLRDFIKSFDFSTMQRDESFIVNGVPPNAHAAAFSAAGRQYAFYIHHSQGDRPKTSLRSYIVDAGSYQETFAFDFAPGTYQAEWVEPATGRVVGTQTVAHTGGQHRLKPPAPYAVDIALRMKSSRRQ